MTETNEDSSQPEFRTSRSTLSSIFILSLAFTLGAVHYFHVKNVFEATTNFSHLSNLEREMLLRTEMGFYYSFYKKIVTEGSLTRLTHMKNLEYPNEINAVSRFNIMPEIVLAGLYHFSSPYLNNTSTCHMVNRGELEPVVSCVGIGEPIIFYLEGIFILAGFTVVTLFVYGFVLSNSIFGAVTTVLWYFACHSDATRVMWAPNQRENFAQPFLLLQMCLTTIELRKVGKRPAWSQVPICLLNYICLITWQFSQFVLLSQVCIIFFLKHMGVVGSKTLDYVLFTHFFGLHIAISFMRTNMISLSLYGSFVFCFSLDSSLFGLNFKVKGVYTLFYSLVRFAVYMLGSFLLHLFIMECFENYDNSHIWSLLLAKFGVREDFHTKLYTCSAVFDFMDFKTWKSLSQLIMIVVVVFTASTFVFRFEDMIKKASLIKKYEEEAENIKKTSINNIDNKEESEITNKTSINNLENDDLSKENDIKETITKETEKQPIDLDDIDHLLDKEINESKETVPANQIKDGTKDKDLDAIENRIKELNSNDITIDPGLLYNCLQVLAFSVLAGLIMRLKLLFVPQLCIVAAEFANKRYLQDGNIMFSWLTKKYSRILYGFYMLVLVVNSTNTLLKEKSNLGEFSDVNTEKLLNWINTQTRPDSVFAASMPLSATIMLSTGRNVVTHPHYENSETRDRTYNVYKLYGNFDPDYYYKELSKLHVTHLVLEIIYCLGKSSQGCSIQEIWNLETPELKTSPQLCVELLTKQINHFYPVYNSDRYVVFKIHDYSLRYMPRTLDT